jgi:hypothetical protein
LLARATFAAPVTAWATSTSANHCEFSSIAGASGLVLNRLNHRVQVEVSVLPMSKAVVTAE